MRFLPSWARLHQLAQPSSLPKRTLLKRLAWCVLPVFDRFLTYWLPLGRPVQDDRISQQLRLHCR
jgi:hypothetical protein